MYLLYQQTIVYMYTVTSCVLCLQSGVQNCFVYSELPLFRASEIRPPRYCSQNLRQDWLAYTLHVKVTLKSSHLVIPLNSQEIQAQPSFLLVQNGRKWA